MDEKVATATGRGTSGIPKPSSRLPLPRSNIPTLTSSTARLQKKPSAPSLSQSSTVGSSRGRQIRPSASQEKVGPPATLPRSYRTSASTTKPQSATAKGSIGKGTSNNIRPQQNQPSSTDSSFKKPTIPKRRPLSQFSHGYVSQPSTTLAESFGSGDSVADDSPELPPLIQSADESAFDSFMDNAERPMPSLSERTIETLSKLPSSPTRKPRGSTFFDVAFSSKGSVSSRPVSRPSSSGHSDGSTSHDSRSHSRPGSSSGPGFLVEMGSSSIKVPITAYKSLATPSKRFSTLTPSATPTITKTTHRLSVNSIPSRTPLSASVSTRTGPADKYSMSPASKAASKTMALRPAKARGSIKGLFNKPPTSPVDDELASELPHATVRKQSLAFTKSPITPGGGRRPSQSITSTTAHSVEGAPPSAGKSSSALRDQIAKAKAAKRAAGRQVAAEITSVDSNDFGTVAEDSFDTPLSDDPFGQKKFEDSNKKVMQSRISTARTTGRLNIAAMGLKEIPEQVLKMYDLESIGGADGSWAESVDVTRLVASDNDLETIDDSIFPDIEFTDVDTDTVDGGMQIFWGLESADLRNNLLSSLPMGLRRLSALNTLVLTSNKLTSSCLEVLSQCTNLRDLQLGNNLLNGPMETSLCLENLEVLDLHGNGISALPADLDKLRKLRILNLDENALESLPFQSLSALPLSELHVRKNKLQGTLIESEVGGFPQLQILDCSNNMLSYLISPESNQPLDMPVLHQLTVSKNQLKALPDMTNWASITTINADENGIAAFPEGFTSRETLRHAEFSANSIRIVPPEIARMESLVMLNITGNPLRDRKFASLTTEAMKDALLARLEPLPSEVGGVESFANGIYSDAVASLGVEVLISAASVDSADDNEGQSDSSENFATPPTSAPHSPALSQAEPSSNEIWQVKPGGVLDRSNTQSSSLDPEVCTQIVAVQSVREVRLDHNTFTQFPVSLSFFSGSVTSLSLAHNQLSGEAWLTEPLNLTALRELNLQSNACTSLTPLATYLCAPKLEKIDASLNRIAQLPALRDSFPSLAVLLIANNRLEDLDPDKIRGLKIVDASNNEIAHLNPRLGLLGGLDRLDVMGNRFRVPRWNILERGTEATLRWLRGRVPVSEMGEWGGEVGGDGEDVSPMEVD